MLARIYQNQQSFILLFTSKLVFSLQGHLIERRITIGCQSEITDLTPAQLNMGPSLIARAEHYVTLASALSIDLANSWLIGPGREVLI